MNKLILLVEDNADTAQLMKFLLEIEGDEVVIAHSVASANKALQEHTFHFLISDLGLPDGSGLEIMQECKLCSPQTRGIALSGYGAEEDIQRSSLAGFQAHLIKPVDFAALQSAMERIANE